MNGLIAIGNDIVWLFTEDSVARSVALFVWIAISFILIPAVGRCIRRRPRYSDPLFSVAFLLVLNRITFGIQSFAHRDVLGDVARWTGIVTAIAYGLVVLDYLRTERNGG